MDRTDEALYESFITQNDEEAIRILFERYCSPLTHFIHGIVRNTDDAEEIMMDCFAVVVAATTRFGAKGGSSFKTWLYAIATKQAKMFLRKNHTEDSFSGDKEPVAGEDLIPENGLLKAERNLELYRGLSVLSADQRTVLYLRYFEDLKPEEISAIMQKSIKQIYKLTDKGKNRLRGLLEDSEILQADLGA